jgi:hypothetical protein
VPAPAGTTLTIGKRIEGSADIPPSEFDVLVMRRAHKHRVVAAVKLCVDGSGAVRGLDLVKSSKLSIYDRRLCEVIKDWRYRPWTIDGAPVSICTGQVFVYDAY